MSAPILGYRPSTHRRVRSPFEPPPRVLTFVIVDPTAIRCGAARLGQSREVLERADAAWRSAKARAARRPPRPVTPPVVARVTRPPANPNRNSRFFRSVTGARESHPLRHLGALALRAAERAAHALQAAMLAYAVLVCVCVAAIQAVHHQWGWVLAMAFVGPGFMFLLFEQLHLRERLRHRCPPPEEAYGR